MFLHCSSVI